MLKQSIRALLISIVLIQSPLARSNEALHLCNLALNACGDAVSAADEHVKTLQEADTISQKVIADQDKLLQIKDSKLRRYESWGPWILVGSFLAGFLAHRELK